MKTTIAFYLRDRYYQMDGELSDEDFEKAEEMEGEQMKEMEFLKFQRDVYIQDIEILKARLREAEQNKN
jgi:hypothetical protein